MHRFVVVVALAVLVSSPALAEEQVLREADRTVVRRQTTIDFKEVVIGGETTTPAASYALGRRPTVFGRLFKVRDNFDPELQRSVDRL